MSIEINGIIQQLLSTNSNSFPFARYIRVLGSLNSFKSLNIYFTQVNSTKNVSLAHAICRLFFMFSLLLKPKTIEFFSI